MKLSGLRLDSIYGMTALGSRRKQKMRKKLSLLYRSVGFLSGDEVSTHLDSDSRWDKKRAVI